MSIIKLILIAVSMVTKSYFRTIMQKMSGDSPFYRVLRSIYNFMNSNKLSFSQPFTVYDLYMSGALFRLASIYSGPSHDALTVLIKQFYDLIKKVKADGHNRILPGLNVFRASKGDNKALILLYQRIMLDFLIIISVRTSDPASKLIDYISAHQSQFSLHFEDSSPISYNKTEAIVKNVLIKDRLNLIESNLSPRDVKGVSLNETGDLIAYKDSDDHYFIAFKHQDLT